MSQKLPIALPPKIGREMRFAVVKSPSATQVSNYPGTAWCARKWHDPLLAHAFRPGVELGLQRGAM